jgi:hypothetical protein
MPEFRCPVGDYTAKGQTIAEAAMDLSRHLQRQHCDSPIEPMSYEQAADLSGDVSAADLGASIDAKGRIEVEPGLDANASIDVDPSIQRGAKN